MISKIMRATMAMVFGLSMFAFAQAADPAAGAAATTPNAPSATPATASKITGTRVGTLNVEQAIFASNEGRRDVDALSRSLSPSKTS